MASMRKKGKSGYYYARFYDPNRRPKQKTVALKTTRKDVARRRLASLEEKYERGAYDPWQSTDVPEHLNVTEAINTFAEAKQGKVRPRTVQTYRELLERWEREHCPPSLLLRNVDEQHLRPFIFQPGIENATQRKRYRHLRAFFNFMQKCGHLKGSPLTSDLKPHREEKQPAFLTPDEFDRLLSCIDAFAEMHREQPAEYGWLKDALQIAICCGLRRGELVRLRWQDVDLEAARLYIRGATKGRAERVVPIPTPALEVLVRRHRERADRQPRVITYRDGTPVKPDCYTKGFKRFVRRAKLRDRERLHLHSLRHSCGAWLASHGVSERIIQQILGHASPVTTRIYSHLMPEAVEAEMKRVFG